MSDTHDPRRGDPGDPVEDALRASLTAHAMHAPPAEALAQRIISSVEDRPPARDLHRVPFRGWRTWALPLVAAGSVAAIVGAVVGIEHFSSEADKAPPAASHSVLPSPPGTGHPSAPTSAPVPASSSTTVIAPVDTSTLHAVQIIDLTFAGQDDGWALASANCIKGAGRCTALLRTTDGTSWHSMPGAAFNVPSTTDQSCADPCVSGIRFANDQVGYAYGASLFMTSNGGRSWQRQPGNVLSLETLDNNVIRVVSSGSGCPGPCHVQVEVAPLGSSSWTVVDLGRPADAPDYGVMPLARGGSDAYLLFTGHTAGGSQSAHSALYRSTDDGQTWTSAGEPCPQTNHEVDAGQVAAAPGGRVTVLCATRQTPQRFFVATSTDHGASFTAQPGTIPAAVSVLQLAGDPSTVLLAAGRNGMARSADGGRSWSQVSPTTPGVFGETSFAGFESPTVARVVGNGERTIWTTHDAGLSWTKVVFR